MSAQSIIVDANLSIRPVFKQIETPLPTVLATPVPVPVVPQPTPTPLVPQVQVTTVERALEVPTTITTNIVASTPRWRRCSDGNIFDGTPPSGFIEVLYGPNDTCWEPSAIITFQPDLSEALVFAHQRGSGTYPESKQFTVNNASDVITFQVNLYTNSGVNLSPSAFTLAPKSSRTVTVTLTPTFIEQLGDGVSTIDMIIELKQII